ncbi:hemerythrin domain-containing protein [Desulfosoma caldarium]|uniref:Hemerythrin-like domain-containing protein n=1 Tax=Desulfosoma caldarium TaxID=610254 RepID=A0A3N1UFK3_9BACT|nr:hemerythrin domain-containing protein [Desulfosoma caldarium]ROQ90135.1 hemerythrin-like domain-containing protein [Desulfosoma caldarium]
MKSIDELKSEHRGIESMLEILKTLSAKIGREEKVLEGDLDGLLEFFKVFVDRCHHGKEEDFLFPALEAVGVLREGGPIGVMLAEHQQGRALVAKLEDARALIRAGGSKGRSLLQETAGRYDVLLRNHINKEENLLFAMAEARLGPSEDEDLHEAFGRLERERIGSGKHQAFHDLMEQLHKRHQA